MTAPLPTLHADSLRVTPLGGLGEIGRNMTVFEHQGKLLIVDCGVLFPEDHQPGVDLILPDFSSLEPRIGDVVGVVLTHGHEDHIGGIPYLIQAGLRSTIVASRLTLGILRAKLNNQTSNQTFKEVHDGENVRIGPFECRFIAVNHSIPDALAVAIGTRAGVVLHTGDFKADQTPLDGRLTDMATFYELGRSGVALLMSDSTNAEVPGFVPTEKAIGPVLAEIVRSAPSRTFVACTSSHIHRIQQVLNAAAAAHRPVELIGRSLLRNFKVAESLGYLVVPADLPISSARKDGEEAAANSVVICTGSQGEPGAALSRMASGDHPAFKLKSGDTVVFASSLIPGNESAVYRVIDQLAFLDVDVITKQNANVHVSGHASAGELTQVLNAVAPKNFLPIHGEGRHLRAHAKLAESVGIAHERIMVVRNGAVIDLDHGVARIAGHVPAGYTYVDGIDVGGVGEESLQDRRILRDEGFISAVAVVDGSTGKLVAGPEISARGFADSDEHIQSIRENVVAEIDRITAARKVDADEMRRIIRRSIGTQVSRNHRRRPMLLVYVLEA